MVVSKAEYEKFQNELRASAERLKEDLALLRKADHMRRLAQQNRPPTEVEAGGPKQDESAQSCGSGGRETATLTAEPEEPAAEDVGVDFDTPLSIDDVLLLAMGLGRLEEAANAYLESDGVEEAATFPCNHDAVSISRNIEIVQKLRAQVVKLQAIVANLHYEMLRQAIQEFVKAQLKEIQGLSSEFLKKVKQ